MKTVASGVDTMMICNVTVMMMTYMNARLLVMPLNTFKDESPSFLELISLKTCMAGHKVGPRATTNTARECITVAYVSTVIAHGQDRGLVSCSMFDTACMPGVVKATSRLHA